MGARFRFIHCADLHLGARFRGVGKKDPTRAEAMRQSVFDSFRRVVDTAISEKVDAMFISGDSFDEDTITPATRYFLAEELRRVAIPVFMVKGNHDPVTSWDESIPFPANVHVFGTDVERLDIPGVEGAEVVGASFREWHDERNIPSMMHGSSDRFTVACVHCDVDNPGADYQYSPCSMSDFYGKGVDYWALGHIHKRSVLSQNPWVVYPGNIQGRSFKESGEKGAYLVTVTDGRVSEARFIPTQGMVWHDLEQDITGLDVDSLTQTLSQKIARGSIARITLTGAGDLDRMCRRNPDDMVKMIESRLGCTISSIESKATASVDPESRRGSSDMTGLVVDQGYMLRDGPREAIIDAICSNPVSKKYRDVYEAMSDEELRGLVDSAMRSLVNSLGVSR